MDLNRIVQVALIGEVPSTLRFLYVSFKNNTLYYYSVFSDDATEDHLESAGCVCTEILSHCPWDSKLEEKVELDSKKHWKIDDGKDLMYLRYGELKDT